MTKRGHCVFLIYVLTFAQLSNTVSFCKFSIVQDSLKSLNKFTRISSSLKVDEMVTKRQLIETHHIYIISMHITLSY